MQSQKYYNELFLKALKRAQGFGISSEFQEFTSKRYFSDSNLEQISYKIQEEIKHLHYRDLTGKCLQIHFSLLDTVKSTLSANAELTFGDVVDTEKMESLFGMVENDVFQWLEKGIRNDERSDLKLHSWITLDSGEILDFTLSTTLALVFGWVQLLGGVISDFPESLAQIKYYPFFTGTDFLFKSGLAVCIQ